MAAKILLIDDNKEQGEVVRLILKSNDYLVHEAPDCDHAISLLENEKFDLILLGITLPERSGFRVLEFLRDNQLDSKVIAMTGTIGFENGHESAANVRQDYVSKPYNQNYLLKSIEHALSGQPHQKLKLQIIKAGDFIQSTPTGDLDMQASKSGFAQIAAAGSVLQEYSVLIDLREVNSRLSTTDIFELATELGTYGETFRRKTAILVRPDDKITQATFFENVAFNRGFAVKVFTVFEEALIWLSSVIDPMDSQPQEHPAPAHEAQL
jgi:DNA-binding response OmpR family regulator